MRIIADTNLLVRSAVRDDPVQADLADAVFAGAELVALPLPVLCEFAWVLRSGYRKPRVDIANALRRLLAASNVRTDDRAAAAGVAALEAGGDFADGCIAVEGYRFGGTIFASFDRRAVAVVRAAGGEAHLLTTSGQGHQ